MEDFYDSIFFLLVVGGLFLWRRRRNRCDCNIFASNKNYELIDLQEEMRQIEKKRK
jgi:hypothetical protein